MFAVADSSESWPQIQESGRFALSILSETQRAVSEDFARSSTHKFTGHEWGLGSWGQPLLAGAIAHVECVLDAVYPGGDHKIVVGRMLALYESREPDLPLLFFRRQYHRVDPALAVRPS
jgi:3-hydroxy-9,10-secoandrosta-1,3,5(10)-triene-9,17-dione monooxygenase reductase component